MAEDSIFEYRIRRKTFNDGETKYFIQQREKYIDTSYSLFTKISIILFFPISYPLYLTFFGTYKDAEYVYPQTNYNEAQDLLKEFQDRQNDKRITSQKTIKQ